MQNYELLRAAGKAGVPVLLKRGLSATIEEWLMSAEYLLSFGNDQVILCERGIRSFESYTRNTTDINAIPVVKELTHLPVILDPSHSTGKWEYVSAVARAGIAAGADGLIVEVPSKARSSAVGWSAEPSTRAIRRYGAGGSRDRARRWTGNIGDGMELANRRITIIGLGLMGGSLALDLLEQAMQVSGADSDPNAASLAREGRDYDCGAQHSANKQRCDCAGDACAGDPQVVGDPSL